MRAWILVVLMLGALPCLAKQQVKNDIPAIAQILSVRVGEDTMETLEKRWGGGASCNAWGHPHGGEVWFIKSLNVYVCADGFDYSPDGGRIVDYIAIALKKGDLPADFTYERPKPVIPKVDAGRLPLGWLGKVLPGDSKAVALKAAGGLPEPELEGHTLRWRAHGEFKNLPIVNLRPDLVDTDWFAELAFKNGKVTIVEVHVDDH